MTYRKVQTITADELLSQLERGGHYGQANAIHQIALFTRLGGDPHDPNYARLSFLTRQLRARGVPIQTSRYHGLWLEREQAAA